jgi:sugar O-acyltransferase (sialic acid O-acetyltransferase NeuD family)
MSAAAGGWLLYGCRTPYALEVAEIVGRRGERIALLVDNVAAGARWTGEEEGVDPTAAIEAPVAPAGALPGAATGLAVTIPMVTPGLRHAAAAAARAAGLTRCPSLLDPTAVVAASASVGPGALVNAGALIGAAAILGRFALVNRGTSIGHHNRIGDFAAFGPGAVLAGDVEIGRGAFIGAGAACTPHVSVGANAVVGAGAVVVDDVPPCTVAVGNPARPIAEVEGFEGFSVPPDAA